MGGVYRLVVPLRVRVGTASLETYALLDNGATGCCVSDQLVEKLNMQTRYDDVTLSHYNYRGTALRKLTDFAIEPLDNSFQIDLSRVLVGHILTTENDKPPSQSDIENYPYMEGVVSFPELDNDHIGLMLSAKQAFLWERGERLSDGPNDPIAVKTMFGWALIGPHMSSELPEIHDDIAINFCTVESKPTSIEEDLDRMFRYDFIARGGEKGSPEVAHPSREDIHATNQFKSTIRFDEELGHYKCGLPWKEDRQAAAEVLNKLDSAGNAANRLRKASEKMKREPARKEGVFKQMKEIIDEGHACRVENPQVPDGIPCYYLPIHVVTRPDKPGKYRVCHDAASRISGICLNDLLLSGPDLVNRLVGVLLRFRRHPVVLSADIKGFFHQCFVNEDDVPVF